MLIEVQMKHMERIKEYAILKTGEFWDSEIHYYISSMAEDAISFRKPLPKGDGE